MREVVGARQQIEPAIRRGELGRHLGEAQHEQALRGLQPTQAQRERGHADDAQAGNDESLECAASEREIGQAHNQRRQQDAVGPEHTGIGGKLYARCPQVRASEVAAGRSSAGG